MDGLAVAVVLIVVIAMVAVAALALVRRGRATTRARLLGVELDWAVEGRDQPERRRRGGGRATIARSRSRAGGATAIGSVHAEIVDTDVHGDLVARVEPEGSRRSRPPGTEDGRGNR